MSNPQLLCTFCDVSTLEQSIASIIARYEIAFDTIYVLQNVDLPDELCCTYNIIAAPTTGKIPRTTISLHRKKTTNTLYTINALNLLVASLNNGQIDRSFKVTWEDYQNCILVTAHDQLKRINTKLFKIVKVSDI